MQKVKKISGILLAMMLWMISVIPIYAATNIQDGVKITLLTDQQTYSDNQKVTVGITVKNYNPYPVEDVVLEGIAPAGYTLAEGFGPKTIERLAGGETATMTVEFVPAMANTSGAPKTGDGSYIMLWSLLLVCILAGAVGLGVVYRKNRKGLLSLMLCLMMLATLLPANVLQVSAKNDNPVQKVTVYETVEINGEKVQVGAMVSYKYPSADSEDIITSEGTNVPEGDTETPGSGTEGDSGSSETPGSGTEGEGGSETPGSGTEGEGGNETPGSGTEGEGGNETPGSGTEGEGGSETPGDDENEIVELLMNGDFETISGNKFADWGLDINAGGEWGSTVLMSTEAYNGSYALGINANANLIVGQTVTNLIAGETYTLTGYIKCVSGTAAVKVEYINSADANNTQKWLYWDNNTYNGEWAPLSSSFTVPEGTDTISLLIRTVEGGGEVYWDDLSLKGKKQTVEEPSIELKDPAEGESDLLGSGDFETVTENGAVPGAVAVGDDWGNRVNVVEDAEREGNVLQIKDSNVTNPWIRYEDVDIQPGAEYQLSAWLKTVSLDGPSSYPCFKIEYFDKKGEVTGENGVREEYRNLNSTGGEWEQVAAIFEAPEERVVCARIYLRLMGAGEIYWDDVEFYMTEKAPYLATESDFFYYTDEPNARVIAILNPSSYEIAADNTLTFSLMDGDTVKQTYTVTAGEATDAKVTWNFPTSYLEEAGKSYTVKVAYAKADGTVLQTLEEEVIRYDRPGNMNLDGSVTDENGDTLNVMMGYHVWPEKENYEKVLESGINVVQCPYQAKDLSAVLEALQIAHETGMKLLIPLYSNMKPAGHPDNVELTKACIEAINASEYKDALFGYMMMDEPYLSFNLDKVSEGSIETMYQYLKDSYKLVREYDKEHVIYTCAATPECYKYVGRTTDILAIDPYINPHTNLIGSKVSTYTENAIKSVQIEGISKTDSEGALIPRKPVWAIVQAFDYDYQGRYLPTANDVRSFLYQGLFAGAQGLGYYHVNAFSDVEKDIWEEDLFEGVLCFNNKEYADAIKAFVTGEYATIVQDSSAASKVWYKLFKTDQDEYYVVLLNREGNNNSVSVDLKAINSEVKSFTAVADDVSGAAELTGGDTLNATLSANQIIRYKLTVSNEPGDSGNEGGGSGEEPETEIGLAKNNSFETFAETGIENWSSYSAGTFNNEIFITTENVHGGSNALGLKGNNNKPAVAQTITGLESGETYILSVYYKTVSGCAFARYEYPNASSSNGYLLWDDQSTNGEWKLAQKEITVPANETSVVILLRTDYTAATTSPEVYYDDVSLVRISQ